MTCPGKTVFKTDMELKALLFQPLSMKTLSAKIQEGIQDNTLY